MNKLLKRGLKAYNIFLKNKLAMSLMMLFAGIMMTIAAINGNGNDTKTLPFLILVAGAAFAFWSFYRLGYIKSMLDMTPKKDEKGPVRKTFFLQILETLLYVLVSAVGVFLLMNEGFTNKALNLMTGGFTTFNGVMGIINTYKYRENKTFRWKFVIILTVFELILGPYFIIASDSIGISSYAIMGIITIIAGTLEVVSAASLEALRGAVEDGKDIVKTLKSDDVHTGKAKELEEGKEE